MGVVAEHMYSACESVLREKVLGVLLFSAVIELGVAPALNE